MTDKTPKDLATYYAIETANQVYEILRRAWLAGYHSRDAEIAEIKKQLNKSQDPYGE